MKSKSIFIAFSFLALLGCQTRVQETRPPLAAVQPVEDTYFGVKITDPYRYMENMKDSAVAAWFKAQSDYTRSLLDKIPGRQGLIDKMTEIDQRKSTRAYSLQITDNDRYFYLKMTPQDQTGKLFWREGFEGTEKLLFDPLTFKDDATQNYTISQITPNHDGTKIAFEIAPNGSESSILMVMDVESASLYPERIDRCWNASPSWLSDNNSFLYNRLNSSDVHDPDREKNSKAFLHVMGTDPSADREVLSRALNPGLNIQPEEFPVAFYDKEANHLFGYLGTVDRRANLYFAPAAELKKGEIAWKRLFKPEDDVYDFYITEKEIFFTTPRDAPGYKIMKITLANPDLSNAVTVVSEVPGATITSFSINDQDVYYSLSVNGVQAKVCRVPREGGPSEELTLPFAAGSASVTTKGSKFSDVWINMSGWINESQRYRFLAADKSFKPENLTSLAAYPELDDMVVEELMVPSHDGVLVPLSLVYKKSLVRDGNHPVFMGGYGAYGVSLDPYFSPEFVLPILDGAIFAVAHVRGGGELGNPWYKGGFKTTKPNTWKDLIACAEYLVREKYTSPGKIAINSASAGGILVGRAMTERPDLFAAAIPEVGCLNALRMEESPNGPVNAPEFGTVKDSVECMALIEMDAYLKIQDNVNYPATLVTAGMNDPRVIAWQPAKFAARLQAANVSDKPILFLADYESGHGIGDLKSKQFEVLADILSFALWQTGHPDFQIK